MKVTFEVMPWHDRGNGGMIIFGDKLIPSGQFSCPTAVLIRVCRNIRKSDWYVESPSDNDMNDFNCDRWYFRKHGCIGKKHLPLVLRYLRLAGCKTERFRSNDFRKVLK